MLDLRKLCGAAGRSAEACELLTWVSTVREVD